MTSSDQSISDVPDAVVRPFRLTFLGSANWDLMAREFAGACAPSAGLQAEVIPVPFGQYRSQMLNPNSILRERGADYHVFCERFEDFIDCPFSVLDLDGREKVSARIDEYLGFVKVSRAMVPGTFFVMDFAPVRPLAASIADATYERDSARGFVHQLNVRLRDFCRDVPDCHMVRLSGMVEAFGSLNADPGKYWHMGRIAFNPPFNKHLGMGLVKMILNLRGRTARVLVTDLDNTLWGGIIGEDGLKGIALGGDFPGNVFVEIQRCLLALKHRGMALAVCSRNSEAIALEAMASHPNMVLRQGDFASIKINWKDKPENIREISGELGLPLSSICFIDDSPYERAAVRRLMPEVIVPDLPEDVVLWPAELMNHPFLSCLYVTAEDLGRAKSYQIRGQLKQAEVAFGSREDYLRSLGMTLYFQKLADHNLPRVLQLLAKTNQFNMTTRRYGEDDLRRLASAGARIIPVGLSDKFSPREIIGLVILLMPSEKKAMATIESFLLSCRVLGRDIESGIIGWLIQFVQQAGYGRLAGLYAPTARNAPCREVYPNHGFSAVADGIFEIDVISKMAPIPDWFEIKED